MRDEDLLERARCGDREALEELCRREWRPVYGIAWAACGNVADAQDLTQEAFARALRALPRYRQTGAPFSAYLATIARNLVRDGWRARRHPTVGLDAAADVPSDDAGPDALALADDDARRLRAALATLPADYRTVIQLRVLDGLSAAAAGHVMGRTPDAVRQLQHRALRALRAALDEDACR